MRKRREEHIEMKPVKWKNERENQMKQKKEEEKEDEKQIEMNFGKAKKQEIEAAS